MGFSLIGTVIGVLLFLPSVFVFIKFPPKNVIKGTKKEPILLTGIERVGQATCLVSLAISKDFFIMSNINIWMILMSISIIIYWGLWMRYIVKGQDSCWMWKPFFFIPIPLAVFPVCAFGFAALWGKCIWLGIATVILAIGHLSISWNGYRQANK